MKRVDAGPLAAVFGREERQPQQLPPRIEIDLADASRLWRAADRGGNRVTPPDARDRSRDRLPAGRPFEIR